MSFERKRDYYAGALIALIGAGAAYQGSTYGIGSLSRMESGFFPTAIGIAMILVGAAIAMTGSVSGGQGDSPLQEPHAHAPAAVDWRGWIAIIAGAGLFMALAEYAGLLPATFACVFISAMGCRDTGWKEALVLAAGVTAFGVALFAFGLKVPIPIWRGM